MVAWDDTTVRLVASADVTVTVVPGRFVAALAGDPVALDGRHGRVERAEGGVTVELLEGEPIVVRRRGKD